MAPERRRALTAAAVARHEALPVDVPEEGALLVVAWLANNGFDGMALDLVAELYPLIDRLRFYPRPTDRAVVSGSVVHRRTASEVAEQLSDVQVPEQVEAMVETLAVWHPLFDRLVALWLQTVDDGWPCRLWPDSWSTDRIVWLVDYEAAAAKHTHSRRHLRPRSHFCILRDALQRCPDNSDVLSARDVGRIRNALSTTIDRWGAPGSGRHAAVREAQATWAGAPTHREIATVIADRLAAYPVDVGVPDLDPVLVLDQRRAHRVP